MSVNLTYIDYKPLTGLQGRGVIRSSASLSSGIISAYRSGLKIEVPNLAPSTIEISSGALLVDTAFVENTDVLVVPTAVDGSFVLVCEVNAGSDNAEFKLVPSITSQDNLTASNTGVYQLELARIKRANGVVSEFTLTAPVIPENLYKILIENYLTKDETYDRSYIDSTYYTRAFINTYFPTKDYLVNTYYNRNYIDSTFYDKSYIYANYYQKSVLYTQNQCKAYFKNIENTRANREVLMYTGASYLEAGQSITLLTGGYAISNFERLVFIFSNYVTGAGAVDNGGGQIAIDNFGVAGSFDGFYNIQTRSFNVDINSAGGTAVAVAVKSWVLASNKVLTGNSNGSSVNKNLVLRSVIGIVTEEAYDSANPRTLNRSSSLNLPTVSVDEIAPDAPLVVMATGDTAYDLTNLTDDELQAVKDKLGIVEEVINDEQ